MLNSSVPWTLLRYILTLGGGALASRGYASSGTVELVVGIIVAMASAGYGAFSSTRDAQIKAAAKLDDVEQVVMTDGSRVLGPQSSSKVPYPPMSDR